MEEEILIMKSPTYGRVTVEEMVSKIIDYIKVDELANYEIAIGTDSQNFDKTKIVLSVVARRVGKGGIFFYNIKYIDLIKNVKEKLNHETYMSLELANEFMDILEKRKESNEFNYEDYNINFQVHVDAGYNGPTSALIPALTAWVKAYGYDVSVKPESFAASSIANKYSK